MQQICAVFDRKTSSFDPPFAVRHVGEAVREWDVVQNDPNTKFGKHKEDFVLFKIGEYDELLGVVTPVQHIQLS